MTPGAVLQQGTVFKRGDFASSKRNRVSPLGIDYAGEDAAVALFEYTGPVTPGYRRRRSRRNRQRSRTTSGCSIARTIGTAASGSRRSLPAQSSIRSAPSR